MGILPTFLLGKGRRTFSVLIVLLFTASGALILLNAIDKTAAADDEVLYQPLAPKPGERTGDWNLDAHPSEFEITANSTYEWLGKQMKKLDFNGDGVEDLAVTASGANSDCGAVYIYDGSYQVTFPRLREYSDSANWKITCNGEYAYFGLDIFIGDANGDGFDDILVGAPQMNVENMTSGGTIWGAGAAFLFYGGPFRDSGSSTITSSKANASFWGNCEYGYFGKAVGMGDIDGDGCDDIFVSELDYGYNYEYNYPDKPDKYEYWEVGYSFYWFGSPSFSGNHYLVSPYADFDGRITGDELNSYYYEYLPYEIDSQEYNYFAMGNYASGDMDGDGRDEIAFGSPYYYIETYEGSEDWYQPGSVFVFHPASGIKTGSTELYQAGDEDYGDWQHYRGPDYSYNYIGYPVSMYDYDQDGMYDIAIGAAYSGSMLYLVKGSSDYITGELYITDSSVYDVAISIPGVSYGGVHAFGDYDGDGKVDIAVGGQKKVYVIENKEFDLTGGKTVSASSVAMLTITGPTEAQYFADAGYMYPWAYSDYAIGFSIVLWNRDDADMCDDVFIADPYYYTEKTYGYSKIYGVANYDMFGIGTFDTEPADGPDQDTMYAEYRNYGFVMSAWNKWDITGTSRMVAVMKMGDYKAMIEYTKEDGVRVVDDALGVIRLDPNYYITYNVAQFEMFVHFNLTITLNLRSECDVDVFFFVYAQHMEYSGVYTNIAKIRHNFKYVGDLEAFLVKGSEWVPLQRDSWMPSNCELAFTGMMLIYDGTEELPDGPYYPNNGLFHIEASNILGFVSTDDSSSGRNFSVEIGAGDIPITVTFWIKQVGIPANKVLNSVPDFTVKVDTDWPTKPPGILVHADAYDDPNNIVDNDGELFVTWNLPGEYNSGIHHYEVIVNGDTSNITTVKSTFAKVYTTASDRIDISVRAVDKVDQIGPWGSSYIYIDRETLDFSDFHPGPEEWFNTLTPNVGITISDIGGRFVVGSSVEYSVSYDGGLTFSEWIPAGFVLNSVVIEVDIEPLLVEGTENMIMFRAMDEAGNQLESDAYPVNVDISGVEFTGLTVNGEADQEGIWIGSGAVSLGIGITDELCGVDAGTIEYRMTTRGRSDLNSAPWILLEGYSNGNIVDIELDVDLDKGDRNYIQFRARDVLENPIAYSSAFNLWINTDPVPVISSPENGADFNEKDLITFDASKSSDYDGDVLTYKWLTSIDGSEEAVVIGEGTIEDLERFEISLSPGEHNITLVAMDGIHEIMSDPIYIFVEEYIFPEWQTSGDKDNDGMPNWFEFEFNLGWNDASNKDAIYDPVIYGSKSKEELWDLLRDDYASNNVQIMASNDFDNDGHSDLEEYLANTDPTDEKEFPLYKLSGEKEEDKLDLLLIIAIIISVLIIIVVLVLLVLNNMAVKSKIEEEKGKDAESEQALLEQAMIGGGSARLEALKAASEGRPQALAPAFQGGEALPSAQMGEMAQAEPMEAAPMQAQPMEAPAPQPLDNMGGMPPQ
ncbi:MAG: FG-GAP repeat protein [Candidatus Thermoplasmatota archaeon]|nr:FG-GAP repeat protein [Candidatus Thermoplasmatota archaeon]